MNERSLGAAGFALAIAVHGLLFLLLYTTVHRPPQTPASISAALWADHTISAVQQPQPEETLPQKPVAALPLAPEPLREDRGPPDIRVEKLPEVKRADTLPPARRVPLEQKVSKLKKIPPESKAVQRPSEALSRLQREAAAESVQRSARATAEAEALSEYQRRVAERVRQLIVFDEFGNENYVAQFEVPILPTREILEVRVISRSGNPAYDTAVERALKALRQLPPPPAGVRLERVNRFYFRLKE